MAKKLRPKLTVASLKMKIAADHGNVDFNEKSRAQILASFGSTLTRPLSVSYNTYRLMRKHPTISLARALVAAAIMAGSWSVEADDDVDDPDEKKNFIRDQFIPRREEIIENAIKHARIDFGWQPFEVIYGQKTKDGQTLTGIEKIKPLLQDITIIKVDPKTGALERYEQNNTGNLIKIEKRYILHIAFDVEGTQWHGQGLMENARESLNQWREANAGAERYDAKVAGAHWVVYYPIGSSMVDDVEVDNFTTANTMLNALESSGSAVVPNAVANFVKELSSKNRAWEIVLLEDKGGRQPTFINRLKYLDALLVRALNIPERAILEGNFGTRAEAGVHGDIVVTNITQWDRLIVTAVNQQPVNEILEQNWGPELRDKVRLVAAPLVDEMLQFLRDIYKLLLTNSATILEEFDTINTDALKDRLGVPKSEETAQAGETGEEGLLLEQLQKLIGRKPVINEPEEEEDEE